MKNILYIGFILCCMQLFVSCKKEIDIPLKTSDVRLVVDGLLTDEAKAHTVRLTLSSSYFDSSSEEPATGALVSISDGSTTVLLTEVKSGFYETPSSYKGEIGKTYTLNIKYKGDEYSGSSLLKPVMTIDSLHFVEQPARPGSQPSTDLEKRYQALINAQELSEVGDCYAFFYYKNGVYMSDTLNRANIINDDFANGIKLTRFKVMTVKAAVGDTVSVEVRSIMRQYFDFLRLIMAQMRSPNTPFTGPPANVEGNMKDITNNSKQVMGYFTVSAVNKASAIIQ